MTRLAPLFCPLLLLGLSGCRSEAPAPSDTDSTTSEERSLDLSEEAPVEAISLLGEQLLRPELEKDFRVRQEALLAEAQADLAAHPDDPDALIWVGRRTAYLGRYREAVDLYSRGLIQHRGEARFYRHRGHRYITLRKLERAVHDLVQAADLIGGKEPEVEPDGLPNERNQPTGTTHSSVWYHLGLAQYLSGDFEKAVEAYQACLRFSDNPDMLVATSHWLYMTLRRLRRDDEAAAVLEPISADMDVIENGDYHRLLLMYKGEVSADAVLEDTAGLSNATLGYGVGNWFYTNGDTERGFEIWREILEGESWAAFGYIAAEAEVTRGP